nr:MULTISPECIES: Fic/DOC family N-terminal domain-containing protein [unclassified Dyella]
MQTQLQRAHEALGTLRAEAAKLPNAGLITRTLVRREAVQSSQIEGTKTNLPELLEYEATQGQDGATPDVTEVERYVHALAEGQRALHEKQARSAIGIDLIKRMHRILLDGAPARLRPGEYRDAQVWIGGGRIEDATFVPPPPHAVAGCMEELENSMLRYQPREDEVAIISIVAQLAIAHAQFETIHPFFDGNGRIGRLIMPLMLAAEGYPPLYLSGYLLRYRRAYYDALTNAQLRGDWNAWVVFLCEAVIRSTETAIAIAKDLNHIHDEWMEALSELKAHSAARQFPRLLLGRPVVSVTQAAEVLGISFVSANNAMKVLVEKGILAEPKGRRNRVFHATRILDRLGQD